MRQVAGDPGRDRRRGVFWCSAAGIDAVGDVAAQPAAELGLFLGVVRPPGRPSADPLTPQIVRAVHREEMYLADPAAIGKPFELLRDERAEQYRGHPGLGNAMRDGQPGLTERRPPDRLATAEAAGGIHQPVGVEGDTLPPQPPGERGEYGALPRAGSTRDDEQRADGGSVITAPALRADSLPASRLHDNRAVA